VARDSAACCIFNSKFVYVFSGRIKFQPKEITDICECYNIDKNIWEIIEVNNKESWISCDLAMAYQVDNDKILIFGGFDHQNRTEASFTFNTNTKTIARQGNLPTVGSFSTMVFHIDDSLYTVGWNNSKKNLYKYQITGSKWTVDDGFTI
jgi:hypothetical protein